MFFCYKNGFSRIDPELVRVLLYNRPSAQSLCSYRCPINAVPWTCNQLQGFYGQREKQGQGQENELCKMSNATPF